MEFYNENYVCKYMVSESTEEYQKDLLNILNISVDLDNLENLTNRITEIYHEVNDEDFIELYKKCRDNTIFLHDSDDEMCFLFLFGYDTLFTMHKLLSYYKKYKKINNDIKKELIDKISEI
tara:strand:+ start:1028 stop:1390 length:363 start_codon:yes stop_codon:yes gene_type:complete